MGDNDNSGNTVSFPQRLGLMARSLGSSTLYIDEQTAALGSIEGNGNLVLDANDNAFSTTLTIGSDNTSSEFDGTILNYSSSTGVNGNIVKTGMGTLNLAGYNIYTGTTTINQGELDINGTLASTGRTSATSMVTVNATGALGGTGMVNRDVTVNSGGNIVPGGAGTVGTLTLGRRPDPQ